MRPQMQAAREQARSLSRRTLLAVAGAVVAATSTAVILMGLSVEWSAVSRHMPPLLPWEDDFPFLFAWSGVFSLVAATLGLIPIALLRRAGRVISPSLAIASGVVLGLCPFMLLGVVAAAFAVSDHEFPARLPVIFYTLTPFFVIGALSGFAGGGAFYFVYQRTGAHRAGAT